MAMAIPYAQATRLAASIGQFIAILFGFLGLMAGNPLFLLIALFVWLGAEAEARQVEERVSLGGSRVRDAMLTEYHTLEPHDTLGTAADLLLAGSQHDFPVRGVDDQPLGILTRDALMSGLAKSGRDGRVGEHARPGLESVEADASLVPALTRLREERLPCLQVVEGGRPIGLLTMENIGEFLMVRTALDALGGSSHGPSRRPVPMGRGS
jgi:CBS domain-containing protein